jgi:hypothetical protein
LTVYLFCSMRGYKHVEYRDTLLTEAQYQVRLNYGQALDGIDWRKLDLIAGGAAFVDLTDLKGLHFGKFIRAKQVIDLWWRVKDRTYQPGRGYEEWVWQSVYAFLRVSGTGGRAWRVVMD